MNKRRLRPMSALMLLVACLFFVGASPFSFFAADDIFEGQLCPDDDGFSSGGAAHLARAAAETEEMTQPAVGDVTTELTGAEMTAELTGVQESAVNAGGHTQPIDGQPGTVDTVIGQLGAVDLAIGQPAVRGMASGLSGARNARNTRGFLVCLLILYMFVNTLTIGDKSCFYVKNQRTFSYIRYSLIILNVIHQTDGKHRQIQVMA